MRLIRHPESCPASLRHSVLALGNFDGVHLGHKKILEQTIALARKERAPAAVMTFEPHPIAVLRPGTEPLRITPFKQKARLIQEAGIETLFALHFTKKFSQMTAEDFIRVILQRQLAVKHIVIGEDFHFGRARGGNAALLEKMAGECGYTLTRMADIGDGERYSSTRIRELLKGGNIEGANALLGHPYVIEGRVRKGDGRGRELLDCPTANIALKDEVRPKFGVYISAVILSERSESKDLKLQQEILRLRASPSAQDDKLLPAITHIGVNATFGGQRAVAETHIFGFSGDLYGKCLQVRPRKFLRAEEKFSSTAALKEAMLGDIRAARSYFGI